MANTTPTPFRNRPNLHLSLTQLSGSPRASGNAFQMPLGTPLATTTYSPFRSAGLKPPTPYGGPMTFTPRAERRRYYETYSWYRTKRILSSKPLWFLLAMVALTIWWFHGGRDELTMARLDAKRLGKDLFPEGRTKDLQFFPANNPKIHYVGRWSATPNRLRKDGTFPGVYFDVTVTNTTTLLLALHNTATLPKTGKHGAESQTSALVPLPTPGHYSFRPVTANGKPASPISLLARVDGEEYIILQNASSLVSICSHDLNRAEAHQIRIAAPMTDDSGRGILELEGLWLSKGGQLLRVQGSLLAEEYEDEDALSAENDKVGQRHRNGLKDLLEANKPENIQQDVTKEDDLPTMLRERRKILEVITDVPGSFRARHTSGRSGGADDLLAGVMGWEYLLGEMFGADHVGIGMDGMCLTQDCVGGVGFPAGLGDVFFRSGPYGSPYFDHPWMFDAYIPDVMVLNIGNSDYTSFTLNNGAYNKTLFDLCARFEETYISLIKAIRTLAYPRHPTLVHSERLGYPGLVPSSTPAAIPIFIMRPLLGQLEHATQNVVNAIRADGDKAVFWLDTSGWLDTTQDSTNPDLFLDENVQPPKWRLSEQGNQRVAIFLHMHICRYLAAEDEKCAFLPHEVYQGKVFNPVEANFDKFLEDEKERKLKKLFWGAGDIEEDKVDLPMASGQEA